MPRSSSLAPLPYRSTWGPALDILDFRVFQPAELRDPGITPSSWNLPAEALSQKAFGSEKPRFIGSTERMGPGQGSLAELRSRRQGSRDPGEGV